MSEITDYLESMQRFYARVHDPRPEWKYQSYEELVLAKGKAYASPERARPKGVRKLADRLCYHNSIRRILDYGWRYIEGYAFGQVTVVQHAWCLDENDIVVETTWKEPGSAYMGVEFSREQIGIMITKTGVTGIFGNDWQNNFSLLHYGEVRENG